LSNDLILEKRMKKIYNLPKIFVLGVFGLGMSALIYNVLPSAKSTQKPIAAVEVKLPILSKTAQLGEALFNKNCATCHGDRAAGTDKGPPFVNDIYNPGHHSDEAFFFAAQNGVRQHHWPFGDMPAQHQVDKEDIAKIIAYVRELQVANGIKYRKHEM
jgi:mono/diheme cytochrome c family protein